MTTKPMFSGTAAHTPAIEEKPKGRHTLSVDRRENLIANGILDVVSFDEETVIAETDLGMMIIKGHNLHISKINLESGDLIMSGEINGVSYDNRRSGGDRVPGKKSKNSSNKNSLMGKLLR